MRKGKVTTRRIAVLTTSRADFGHLYWPLRAIQERPDLDLKLIAMGAHLSPEFGTTVDEIGRCGFVVNERVECLLSSDTDTGMAKTIGLATLSLADVLDRMRPDILLLIADRYELLAAVAAAVSLRIPVAHIEGGEISEGAIDDVVRNALTKISHLHFTPTQAARQRVLAMGEEAWRVHRVGAPSLDYLTKGRLLDRSELGDRLGIEIGDNLAVVACHPVTMLDDTTAEAKSFFHALEQVENQIVFCFPNSDAGSRTLILRARKFCDRRQQAHLFINLDADVYLSLLANARLMIGNSSSGIMETPSFELPTVNVGIRQQGRVRAGNIIDSASDSDAIVAAINRAIEPSFRRSLKGLVNPYGDGRSAERITRVLCVCPLGDELLIKNALTVTQTKAGPAFHHDVPDSARRA